MRNVLTEQSRSNSPKSKSDLAAIFTISFEVKQADSDLETPGCCWHKMFRNPVIVKGYPILARQEDFRGVEMPLSMMAKLVRTERVNQFDGKTFLKGFSSMLVAVRLTESVLTWHYLYEKEEGRLTYLDHKIQQADFVALHRLDDMRHVIGWCGNAHYYAGRCSCVLIDAYTNEVR